MHPTSRARLALAGGVAGLGGIVASDAATDLLHQRATPIEIVAETVIAVTPASISEPLIHLVGRNDKPILVGGTVAVILLLGAVAGVLTARRPLFGQLVFWVMATLALVAAVTRPDFSAYTLAPLAVGVLVWTVLLDWLTGLAGREPAANSDVSTGSTNVDSGRGSTRRFVLTTGAVAVGSLLVGAGGRAIGSGRRAVESSRRLLKLPVTRGAVPAGADGGAGAGAGIAPWRSSNAGFYRIDTAVVVPTIEPADWRLRIHGLVDKEITLTYDDLLERKLTEDWVTICCVSNEVGGDLIGNAWWSGVRIADLLEEAGVQPGADAVKQTSHDGWTCGTPVQALTDDRNAMLAVAMNGQPLPIEHGFPVRTIVPGLYGYVSATKWVVDLEVTRFRDFAAYWTDRGWSVRGPVKTESRVEVPRGGSNVGAGSVRVGGHAWAQHTGVEKVEFRLDGGPWQDADLGRVPGVDTWVQWSGSVQAGSGDHRVTVRATDRSGYTQTPARVDVIPNGATGWHSVSFSAG